MIEFEIEAIDSEESAEGTSYTFGIVEPDSDDAIANMVMGIGDKVSSAIGDDYEVNDLADIAILVFLDKSTGTMNIAISDSSIEEPIDIAKDIQFNSDDQSAVEKIVSVKLSEWIE